MLRTFGWRFMTAAAIGYPITPASTARVTKVVATARQLTPKSRPLVRPDGMRKAFWAKAMAINHEKPATVGMEYLGAEPGNRLTTTKGANTAQCSARARFASFLSAKVSGRIRGTSKIHGSR